MLRSFHLLPRLFTLVLCAGALLLAGCDSNDDNDDNGDAPSPEPLRSVAYDLAANANSGALPNGVSATATFFELGPNRTLVQLELASNTGASLAHPAHIHGNTASEGGPIEIFLSPIDGTGGGGTSARIVDESFDALMNYDGYINIHESNANLGAVVAQGDIGANATGTMGSGLTVLDDGRQRTYALAAQPNSGALPNGVSATARFIEVTATQTLVQLELDAGPTGAAVGHAAHIHQNSASEGGPIAIYLSPLDGTDNPNNAPNTSTKLVNRTYDELTGFDGYINIHESPGALGNVVAQGDIGANSSATDDASDPSY